MVRRAAPTSGMYLRPVISQKSVEATIEIALLVKEILITLFYLKLPVRNLFIIHTLQEMLLR